MKGCDRRAKGTYGTSLPCDVLGRIVNRTRTLGKLSDITGSMEINLIMI